MPLTDLAVTSGAAFRVDANSWTLMFAGLAAD